MKKCRIFVYFDGTNRKLMLVNEYGKGYSVDGKEVQRSYFRYTIDEDMKFTEKFGKEWWKR